MKCECILAGYCERHGTAKTDRMVELCQTNVAYWDAWESGRLQDVGKVPAPAKKPTGPGTELKLLLAARGYTIRTKGCGCKDRIRKMNAWGVDGCKKRRAEIIDWLSEAADSVSWSHSAILRSPVFGRIAKWKIGQLLDEAIANAAAKAEKCQ